MKKQNKNNTLTFKKPSFLELTNKSLSKIVGGYRHPYLDDFVDNMPEWLRRLLF
jgi:bacteriocin-like protein